MLISYLSSNARDNNIKEFNIKVNHKSEIVLVQRELEFSMF